MRLKGVIVINNYEIGRKAEELFQKLVPKAFDVNKKIKMNNPDYDFIYEKATIDVKYSSIHQKNDENYWEINTEGKRDLIVAFLERKKGSKLNNPIILIIPKILISVKRLHISPNNYFLFNFKINNDDIENTIKEYARLYE